MNNFPNWYSVAKDGLPKRGGMYLTIAKYKCGSGLTRIEKTWYRKIPKRWRDARDMTVDYGIIQEKDPNYFVTHYIPLSEIPMPKQSSPPTSGLQFIYRKQSKLKGVNYDGS